MGKVRGTNCSVLGCSKRRKKKSPTEGESFSRSDSDGSEDDESAVKRKFARTFHR